MRHDVYYCTYGSSKTKDLCHVYKVDGLNWYAVDGSVNVNATYDDIFDGVNVEELQDTDTFTASKPITCSQDIANELID